MIHKNILLATLLTTCFAGNSKAEENVITENIAPLEADDIEEMRAIKIAAAAAIEMAKIAADARIEVAKIEAEASKQFGVEAARQGVELSKQWAPIVGSSICLFGLFKLYSILR